MKPSDLPPSLTATLTGPAPLRTGAPYREELAHCRALLARLEPQRAVLEGSRTRANVWIEALRRKEQPPFAVERLLAQFPISTAEGLALLRLAEALLRIPDVDTAALLAADVFAPATFSKQDEEDMIAKATRSAINLGKKLLPEGESELAESLLTKLGAQTFVRASRAAVAVLSQQFVFASNINDGVDRAAKNSKETVSFDMLGEGARNEAQAKRYLAAYHEAIIATAKLQKAGSEPHRGANVSIKLTALHPRFEEVQRAHVLPEMLERVAPLVEEALKLNVPITIDAEESERLELSLDLIEALIERTKPAPYMLGLAIQAYGLRALDTISHIGDLAAKHGVKIAVRLVKGAYWDAEVKRAQELGLPNYPVFTHKQHTDLSYLACATRLFELHDRIYPMFATHNAATLAAIRALAGSNTHYEFQRLHGMGESLYEVAAADLTVPVRIYAPVGEPRDLLAYLVRRLLENGANTSFVHQLADPRVPAALLTELPFAIASQPALPMPVALYGASRANSKGLDVQMRAAVQSELASRASGAGFEAFVLGKPHGSWSPAPKAPVLSPNDGTQVGTVQWATKQDVAMAIETAHAAWPYWEALPVTERADMLRRAADLLEARMADYLHLLAIEAGKTTVDGVAEVREAIDFLRYYAHQAESLMAPDHLPGPTGETNVLTARGRGVWVCISPWNFPLAIFAGQVAAALVTGNSVIAKPAEQTPLVAHAFVKLMFEAGVPQDALYCLPGAGEVGAALTQHPLTAGVAFTGSTQVAKLIAATLATKPGPLAPLIAETGGINAMIVDSTALPEQVIDAVVMSAFRSAGQRCSALRVLCVQDDIADELIAGIGGALEVLRLGHPADPATDVGPIIDREALERLQTYERELSSRGKAVGGAPKLPEGASGNGNLGAGYFFAPVAYELPSLADVKEEVFGPVLHIVRYKAKALDALMDEINALGYGLTLGVQTRITARAEAIARKLRVGNVYVNRSMIGAVVGVQPFGGQGLSGTGPKAGGPHYLTRFVTEQTVTINTAAAGGNATLLASFGS
jgi:RHH-type proline utilization regulon transcriptional repressor/proline dehydrogenase/delta 1-pyrroline-5-carboxylate dehydrogenase